MNFLQITLLCNTLFSFFSGACLIFFRTTFSIWLGVSNPLLNLIVGLGLLFFSAVVAMEIDEPMADMVFVIILLDFAWVLLSAVFLGLRHHNIPIAGKRLIIVVAFIVLYFGIGQSIGLAQLDTGELKGFKTMIFEREVKATKQQTWKVVSDVSNYHHVAPNIDSVVIISGEGVGMVRSCKHRASHWTEVATLWEEGERYSFKVDTDAKDYPYPLKYLRGTWIVESITDDRTKIIMKFSFAYKRRIYNLLIHPFVSKRISKTCEELFDNWEKALIN